MDLRLASRDTHDIVARVRRGDGETSGMHGTCGIPTRLGVLETVVSAHSSKYMSIIKQAGNLYVYMYKGDRW